MNKELDELEKEILDIVVMPVFPSDKAKRIAALFRSKLSEVKQIDYEAAYEKGRRHGNSYKMIPITERLPENGRDVLVTDGQCFIVACYVNGEWDFFGVTFWNNAEVVGWQELPPIYRNKV